MCVCVCCKLVLCVCMSVSTCLPSKRVCECVYYLVWVRPRAVWQCRDADDWMLKAAPLCLTQLSAAATLAEPLICSVRSSSSTKSKSVAVSSHFVLFFFQPLLRWPVLSQSTGRINSQLKLLLRSWVHLCLSVSWSPCRGFQGVKPSVARQWNVWLFQLWSELDHVTAIWWSKHYVGGYWV